MSKVERRRPGQKLTASKESLRVGDGPQESPPPLASVAVPEPEPEVAPQRPEPEVEAEPRVSEAQPDQQAAEPSAGPVSDPEPEAVTDTEAPETSLEDEPSPAPTVQNKPGRSVLGEPPELRAAWKDSVLSARNDSKRWTAYSVTLPPDVWERLEARVEADQRRYGASNLGMNHYINAALSRIPKSAKQAAALATEYTAGHGIVPPPMRPSGTRVHQDVQVRMSTLRTQLRRVARPGLLGHLQAAAVTAMLDGLDAADAAS